MSTFKDVLRSGLEEYLERLQVAIEGLTPAEVRWQPTMNTNPIAWMVWHMARVEDSWLSRLRDGTPQVWTSEGLTLLELLERSSGHASSHARQIVETRRYVNAWRRWRASTRRKLSWVPDGRFGRC